MARGGASVVHSRVPLHQVGISMIEENKESRKPSMGGLWGRMGGWWKVGVAVAIMGILRALWMEYGWEWDKNAALELFREMSDRLGKWAIPVYVAIHTLTLALCLPYAVFFEAGASLLFGFFPAVLCVFFAKLIGASLSFWIGRLVFRSSSTAMEWAHRNRYFHLLSRGVERDGWKFVLLARFSPMPSYVINYALAATKVGFLVDFLIPTIIGCLPMILQNTSIGSLAGAAVASASGSQKSQVLSYLFPSLGIVSSIIISLRIKKYSTEISVAEFSSKKDINDCNNSTVNTSENLPGRKGSNDLKRSQ